MQSKKKQQAYRELIRDLTDRVLARQYLNHKDLVKQMGRKTGSFATKSMHAAIRFGFTSREAWKGAFPEPGRRVQVWICPGCGLRYQNRSKFDKTE